MPISKSPYPIEKILCAATYLTAGGVGFALKTFLHAEVVSGIDYILDLINYDEIYKDYDLIITGEGKIDTQSLQGKVISSIINKTKERDLLFVCAINELEILTFLFFKNN